MKSVARQPPSPPHLSFRFLCLPRIDLADVNPYQKLIYNLESEKKKKKQGNHPSSLKNPPLDPLKSPLGPPHTTSGS